MASHMVMIFYFIALTANDGLKKNNVIYVLFALSAMEILCLKWYLINRITGMA